EITFFDRDEFRWGEDVHGVIVENAEGAGWAGLGGIHPGDLIQKIGATEIKGIDDYRSTMEKVAKEQPERVVMVVLRGARTYYQFLEPEWKPTTQKDEKAKEEHKSSEEKESTKETLNAK